MKILYSLKSVAAVMAGNIIVAFAISAFILPQNLIAGGSTGLAIILNHYFQLNISLIVIVFNVLMFLVGAILLGKKFALTTLLSTLTFPSFFSFFQTVPALQSLTDDTLLSAVYAGLLCGLGVGLVFKVGSSTGGMDIPALILNKHFRLPVALGMYAFDVLFLLIQAFFSNTEQILYGLIQVLLTSIVINKVMVAGSHKIQLFIISRKYQEIKEALLFIQDVGVTMVNVETAYEGIQQQAALCVVDKRKSHDVTERVKKIDPNAFIIIGQIHEVAGEGFTLERRLKAAESVQ